MNMSKRKKLEIATFIGTVLAIIGALLMLFSPNSYCMMYKIGAVVGCIGMIITMISTIMIPTPPCDKRY
jgi:hypothetical protein